MQVAAYVQINKRHRIMLTRKQHMLVDHIGIAMKIRIPTLSK